MLRELTRRRSAFGTGLINRLALRSTSTDGLAIRTIDSPTAFREVALVRARRRAETAGVKVCLEHCSAASVAPEVIVHPLLWLLSEDAPNVKRRDPAQ
ncbi:hypothetical protein [Streptomyces sp. NPDC090798]|uniref:hypothetical protein n=1 Tax=Streptomyces sp. NPDC090798 TaxID=3365968 RepID=UPI003814960D